MGACPLLQGTGICYRLLDEGQDRQLGPAQEPYGNMAHTHPRVDIEKPVTQLEQPARETRAVSRRDTQRTDEREADLPSMRVAGKDQSCGRALRQLLKRFGSMGQHQRERGVGDPLEAGIQIGVPKVRVVSADKPHTIAMSTQHDILICEDSNTRLRLEVLVPRRNALSCRKSPMVPVPGYDNHRHYSNGPQLAQECKACRCLLCAIDQVTCNDDKRGMLFPDDVDCHAVSPRNVVEVQVRQLHDLHAVEAGRQPWRRDRQPSNIQLKRLPQETFNRCGTCDNSKDGRSCLERCLSAHDLSSSREDIPKQCLPSPQESIWTSDLTSPREHSDCPDNAKKAPGNPAPCVTCCS